MPVYNGARYLRQTLESILKQSFSDFELIVINDASTDNSAEIVESYADSRIRIVNNSLNIGQTSSLNKGIRIANGEYIAIHDQDDVSALKRFEKQVIFLDSTPEIPLVGTNGRIIDSKGNVVATLQSPTSDLAIKWNFLFQGPIFHSSVMFRKKTIMDEFSGYNEEFKIVQDFDLWTRILEKYALANLPERLLDLRVHPNSSSRLNNKRFSDEAFSIYRRYHKTVFGKGPTPDMFELFTTFSVGLQKTDPLRSRVCLMKTWDEFVSLYPGADENMEIRRSISGLLYKIACLGYRERLASYATYRLAMSFSTRDLGYLKLLKLLLLYMGFSKLREILRSMRLWKQSNI